MSTLEKMVNENKSEIQEINEQIKLEVSESKIIELSNILKECTELPYGNEITGETAEIAHKALEELQEYRKIGTVEELKTAQKYIDLAKKHGTIGKVIDICTEYEAIGTVEELKNLKNNEWNPDRELKNFKKEIIFRLIKSIEKEIENSGCCTYECEEGTKISTDVGCVTEWFRKYKKVIKKRYGIKEDSK